MPFFGLYDNATKQLLEADGAAVWSSEYIAKCKYNHFVRKRLNLKLPYSKQNRVFIRSVQIVLDE